MDEHYLFSLIVVFLFSLVFLKKEKKPAETLFKVKVTSNNDKAGASGVAKYLQKQEAEIIQSKVTGVAKYLQEKEILNVIRAESLAKSGVAKYLAAKEETAVSGVGKYMARKAVQAKKMEKENVSGVEKYLNNRG